MKRNIICFMTLCVCFIVLGAFAFERQELLLKNISDFETEYAVYLDDEAIDYIPDKKSGYSLDLEKSNCTHGVTLEFDYSSYNLKTNFSDYDNTDNSRVKCDLYFKSLYEEDILNDSTPVFKEDLTPVTISDSGEVKKADITKEWYSYKNQQWANAVITQNSYDALNNEGNIKGATKNIDYVSFDGIDDYAYLGLKNYDFGEQITMSVTLRRKNDNYADIFGNFDGAGVGFTFNGSRYQFAIYSTKINGYTGISLTEDIKINEWVTITATFNKNVFKIYCNGILSKTETIDDTTIKVSPMAMILGANPASDDVMDSYAKVDVKDYAIYNRALDEQEIKNSMSFGIKITNGDGLLKYGDFTSKKFFSNSEIIPEDIIESYFVWIPKYRYKLWDLGNYDGVSKVDTSQIHNIDILFGDYDTNDNNTKECTTPMLSGETGNCNIGDYMTHPAFLSIKSSGFWVGKFVTSYKGATTSGANDNGSSEKISIKPNIPSWWLDLSHAHLNSYQYKRTLDSHSMKNTEWGAVAYLQHSIYGSHTSLRLNNDELYRTGYAANNEPTCGYTGSSTSCNTYCKDNSCNEPYNSSEGYNASTTGNITGVYDMAGLNQIVMGVMASSNGVPLSGTSSTRNSGFNGLFSDPDYAGDDASKTSLTSGIDYPEAKYYDLYKYSTTADYSRRILGDATAEMGPFETKGYASSFSAPVTLWYEDLMSQFYLPTFPIAYRGYYTSGGTFSGIFALQCGYGTDGTFRIILTPTK